MVIQILLLGVAIPAVNVCLSWTQISLEKQYLESYTLHVYDLIAYAMYNTFLERYIICLRRVIPQNYVLSIS